MRTLALDATTGDLAIRDGRPAIVDGVDAVAQKLRFRFRLWRGEWARDTRVGIPYASILGVKGSQLFAESVFRRAITTCPGVAGLDVFTFRVDARRRATVSFKARAVSGEVIDVQDFVAGSTA